MDGFLIVEVVTVAKEMRHESFSSRLFAAVLCG